MKALENLRINTRILLIVALSISAMLALGSALIYQQYVQMIDSRIATVRNITETAVGVAERLHDHEQKGEMSHDEAIARFRDAIYGMWYENHTNYLFVWTLDGTPIAHPAKPTLEGKSLIDLKDKNGVPLARLLAENSQIPGGKPVHYVWPKPGSDTPMPKISYSLAFMPWKIFVGTGIYTDDVDSLFKKEVAFALGIAAIALAFIAVLSTVIARSLTRPISSLQNAMMRVADGDTNLTVAFTDNKAEIGDFARALDTFKAQTQALAFDDAGRLPRVVDMVQIDAECYDFEVLKLLDFTTLRPLHINYESSCLPGNDKARARAAATPRCQKARSASKPALSLPSKPPELKGLATYNPEAIC